MTVTLGLYKEKRQEDWLKKRGKLLYPSVAKHEMERYQECFRVLDTRGKGKVPVTEALPYLEEIGFAIPPTMKQQLSELQWIGLDSFLEAIAFLKSTIVDTKEMSRAEQLTLLDSRVLIAVKRRRSKLLNLVMDPTTRAAAATIRCLPVIHRSKEVTTYKDRRAHALAALPTGFRPTPIQTNFKPQDPDEESLHDEDDDTLEDLPESRHEDVHHRRLMHEMDAMAVHSMGEKQKLTKTSHAAYVVTQELEAHRARVSSMSQGELEKRLSMFAPQMLSPAPNAATPSTVPAPTPANKPTPGPSVVAHLFAEEQIDEESKTSIAGTVAGDGVNQKTKAIKKWQNVSKALMGLGGFLKRQG